MAETDENLWERIPAYTEVKIQLPNGQFAIQRQQVDAWKWKGEVEKKQTGG